MKHFLKLFQNIESTTSTNAKTKFLVQYFNEVSDEDKLWVVALFSHRRPRRTVTTSKLREWAAELAGIPLWLFEDAYHIVGDLAETIAKVVPDQQDKKEQSLSQWIHVILGLADLEEEQKKDIVMKSWTSLSQEERFLFNKIITGGFRMGISQKTITKAVSQILQEEENIIAHRLMGNWTPISTTWDDLLLNPDPSENLSKPYPFYLAYALDKKIEEIGSAQDWMAEYKWDGIRSQLIKRSDQIYLWSRGEEIITHQFPEFEQLSKLECDFVIDGELLIYSDNKIRNFNTLQKRLGRKKPSKKLIAEYPAIIMVYDILEYNSNDIRDQSQSDRRKQLEILFSEIRDNTLLNLSQLIAFKDWKRLQEIRKEARNQQAEGLMLKSKKGEYKTGRKKGDWFKWKLDPMVADVVMIYAQRGHGRRSNLFTDFTFAVKDGENLVPIAKAYSGLTDDEFREISRFVRANTIERFGPVSSVPAVQVFEIAFDSVSFSTRHKSGIALRFPRILRWRKDKPIEEINTLQDLKSLILD